MGTEAEARVIRLEKEGEAEWAGREAEGAGMRHHTQHQLLLGIGAARPAITYSIEFSELVGFVLALRPTG